MSIISVNELADGRGSSVNDKGEREYTRTFQVITDSALDGPLYVRLASGIPQRGDLYVTSTENDLAARVKTVTPIQDGDNPKLWRVRVDYSTTVPEQDSNPLMRPAEYEWSFARYETPATIDIFGRPVVNSAGQEFDPPVMMDNSRPVLTVSRNEAAFNPSIAIAYQDATNSDFFLGFAPGQVKVMGIEGRSRFENEYAFWVVRYEFQFQREGWQKQILDIGRYRKRKSGDPDPKPGEPKLVEITIGGQPLTDPVQLDGKGQPVDDPTPETAVYLPYRVYKELPFAALAI